MSLPGEAAAQVQTVQESMQMHLVRFWHITGHNLKIYNYSEAVVSFQLLKIGLCPPLDQLSVQEVKKLNLTAPHLKNIACRM